MVFDLIDGFSGNATVQGNKIHAILCMQTYNINKIFCRECCQVSLIVYHRIVYRYSSNHRRTFRSQFSAESCSISMGRQIHDCVRPHIHRCHNFLHFNIIIFPVPGYSEIDIDFGSEHGAHTLRIQTFMVFICADGNLSGCHQRHQLFHTHVFLLCNFL